MDDRVSAIEIEEPGSKYCCLACFHHGNRHGMSPQITHTVLQQNVIQVTLPEYFTGPAQKDPEIRHRAFDVVNVHFIEPRDPAEQILGLGRGYGPLIKTLNIHCNKCHSEIGKIYTDKEQGVGNIGESYRMFLVDMAKVVLIDERMQLEARMRALSLASRI